MSNKNKSVQVLTKGVEFLFKKNKVTYLKGKGSLLDKNRIVIDDKNNKQTIESKNIIISTGSEAACLPGVDFDEVKIVSSTGALNMNKVPQKMLIIGGGYICLLYTSDAADE